MIEKLMANIERVFVGKREVIEKLILALLCGGHVLIEDVPGVGKTTLAQALAKSLDCSFSRIQFTPDLVPSDIIGVSIYNPKESIFEFRKGPIHYQIILADEINRTSPKTQSSLLEVMQEKQVTNDGITYKMQEPFMVIATQNPIEYEGTFPLPEAQLDRFLIKISIGYPSEQDERKLLEKLDNQAKIEDICPILNTSQLLQLKQEIEEIYVSDQLKEYIVNIIRETRKNEYILLGASPRATLALYQASKAVAYMRGRSFVTPDDIKYIAESVLSHRLLLKPDAKYKGLNGEALLENILRTVKVPLVRVYE